MIENVEAGAAITPDANGVGLQKASAGYAKWMTEVRLPGYCEYFGYEGEMNTDCMDTYNPNNKLFTGNQGVYNLADAQWQWMLCNEPLSFHMNGAPPNKPSIASRMIQSSYWQRQCSLYFPTTNGYTFGSGNVHTINQKTEGWRLTDTTRLIWTNGQFDPWRTAGMSSEFRPNGAFLGTEKAPLQIIPAGIHCGDLRLQNAHANSGVQMVVDNEVKQIVQWVSEYPKKN